MGRCRVVSNVLRSTDGRVFRARIFTTVAEIPVPHLGPFLNRLEWPGPVPTVLGFLSGMHDVSDRFMMAFDVTEDGALLRLGLEMYPTSADGADYRALLSTWLTTTKTHWRGLTDRLADMELCLPAKAEGLLSWPKRHNASAGRRTPRHAGFTKTLSETKKGASGKTGSRLILSPHGHAYQ